MSEPIREQISAFLDGELPTSETELLLKRLTRDAELRESFGRYALIGEAMRGTGRSQLTHGFAGRVNATIDGEPAVAVGGSLRARPARWWRPVAGAAVAASVAAVAVVALQQRAVSPGARLATLSPPALTAPALTASALTASARAPLAGQAKESDRPYVVPAAATAAPATVMPAARLTNYIFAHSRYSSVLGQSNVLSGLLTDPDETGADDRHPGGAAVNDAALRQTLPADTRIAP